MNELADSKNLADNDIMVPVDLRGTGYYSDIFYDRDCFYEVLNPIAAAEAFVVAAVEFQLNKNGGPEDERPPPITAAEWRQILTDFYKMAREEELPPPINVSTGVEDNFSEEEISPPLAKTARLH